MPPKHTHTQKVTQHIQQLPSPFADIIEAIRKVILTTDNEIAEHIKWNSPAFYYNGEMKAFDLKKYKRDLLVINLHRGNILLVFPTGATIKKNTTVLEGNYTDGRRLVKIVDMDDLKQKETSLHEAIKEWLSLIEK